MAALAAVLLVVTGCADERADHASAHRYLEAIGIVSMIDRTRTLLHDKLLGDFADIPESRAAIETWLAGRQLLPVEAAFEVVVMDAFTRDDLERIVTFLDSDAGHRFAALGAEEDIAALGITPEAEFDDPAVRAYFAADWPAFDRFRQTEAAAKLFAFQTRAAERFRAIFAQEMDATVDSMVAMLKAQGLPLARAPQAERPADGVTLIVAGHDLPAGTALDDDVLAVRTWAPGEEPEQGFTPSRFDELDGGVLVSTVASGEPLIWAAIEHRRVVVPRRDLAAGTTIGDDNLAVRRVIVQRVPDDAVTPDAYPPLRGRVLVKAVGSGEPISLSVLARE